MIADIHLQNFRSYEDSSFEFEPGVNIIVGPNASGKTNLLESILFIARGKSYRVKDIDLVSFQKDWLRIDARMIEGLQRTAKIQLVPIANKSYEIDGKQYKRLTLRNFVPVVLFEPNHLQLLSGGPDNRREYMDEILKQTTASYTNILNRYKRVLAQRNALLKHPPVSFEQIFPWNVRLSELAGQIVRMRTKLSNDIEKQVQIIYPKLSDSEASISIIYDSRWPEDAYETNILRELDNSLQKDILRGFTSLGPHREDLVVKLNDHIIQESASRGETRSIVLAMKITELKIIEDFYETSPLLLLDDVFSELDGKRRHALTSYISKYQTFITTTDADLVLENFVQICNVIALS